MTSLRTWCSVHAPAPLVAVMGAAIGAELAWAPLPLLLPWAPDTDLRWGLLLPLVTIACAVSMLHTGLGDLERGSRRQWRGARALWCAFLAVVSCLPAWVSFDGLEVNASIRNRLVLFAVTVGASMMLPSTLAILPASGLLMGSMLVAGTNPAGTTHVWLMQAAAPASHTALGSGLLLVATLSYAFGYPPRWSITSPAPHQPWARGR